MYVLCGCSIKVDGSDAMHTAMSMQCNARQMQRQQIGKPAKGGRERESLFLFLASGFLGEEGEGDGKRDRLEQGNKA